MEKAIYKELVRSSIQPGEWEYPTPLVGEFETTLPTPTQVENDQLGTTAGDIPMIKTWDLAPVDLQSFDPFEPPGRPPSAPTNITPPVVSGNPVVGQALFTTNGTWTGNPTQAAYQWRRNGTNIVGATNTTYTLVAADDNAPAINCSVTATNAEGSGSAVSNAVGPIVRPPPTNSVAPVISGADVVVGTTLTATNGTWTNSPTYTRAWRRGGTNIPGATAVTYVLAAADVGSMITCNVTATNSGGAVDAISNALGPVTATAEDPGDDVQPRRRR
jgi:hypothetical protein